MSSTLTRERQAMIGPTPEELKLGRRHSRKAGIFDPELLKTAFRQSFIMLRPDIQWKNPVMFMVEVGTVLTIIYTIAKLWGFRGRGANRLSAGPGFLAGGDVAFRELRLRHGRGPRQGPGQCLAEDSAGHTGLSHPHGSNHPNKWFRPTLAETSWKWLRETWAPGDGEIVEGVASFPSRGIRPSPRKSDRDPRGPAGSRRHGWRTIRYWSG